MAEAHGNLANLLTAQGKLEEAVAEYRTAIRLKPELAAAHYNLRSALADQAKHNEAIEAYREAVRLKPDYAVARNGLGNALLGQGEVNEAIAEYHAAIRIKPDDDASARFRGQALDWLKIELAFQNAEAESRKPEANALVTRALQSWKTDPDLAGVRDPEAIRKLPESERNVWRASGPTSIACSSVRNGSHDMIKG